MSSRRAFTLIELLVVIAIIAILAVVVVLTLNPAQLLAQARDANRVQDLSTMNSAIGLYRTDVPTGSLGTSSIVYTSLPDSSPTCSNTNDLAPLPASDTYACASQANYRKTDGTGWIPIDFKAMSYGAPFGSLPIDPVNQASKGLYYTYETNGTQYEVTAGVQSTKYQQVCANESGTYSDLCTAGTNLALAPINFYSSSTALGNIPPGTLPFNVSTTMGNALASQTTTEVFSGTAGQTLAITFDNGSSDTFSSNGAQLRLYSPTGSQLASVWSGQGNSNGIVVSDYTLPSSGTYTLELFPGTNTGQVTVYMMPYTVNTGTLAFGTSTVMPITQSNQIARYTFSGTAGQVIDVYTQWTGIPTWGADLYFKSPSGATLFCGGSSCPTWDGPVVQQYTLPDTGTYTVELDPFYPNTGSVSVELENHIYTSGPTLAFGPTASTTLSVSHYYETTTSSFTGTAGQIIDVYTTWSGFPGWWEADLYFKNASGTTLFCGGAGCPTWDGPVVQQYTLPYTGTYNVTLQPNYPYSGNVSVQMVNHVYATGTVAFGTTTTIPIAEYYATGLYTFSGTAGQTISIYTTFTGFPTWQADLYLENPSGTVIAANGGGQSTWDGYMVSNYSLPSTGTYTLKLTASYPYTGTAEVYLTSP
jgi:prepilin-type N-terminal cleavage/methylation domain-containing protein